MENTPLEYSKLQSGIHRLILSSRWLQAPIYLSITLVFFAFIYVVFKDVIGIVLEIKHLNETDLALKALSLIDAILVANLLVIVIISGFENFVAELDFNKLQGAPRWIKKLTLGDVKMKIASSLIAISAIQLLKQFINIPQIEDRELWWNVGIHLTFVISALLLSLTGYLDRKTSEK